MFSVNALLYTLAFAVIAFGVALLWSQAPLGQRVHAVAILINSLTFIAGGWSATGPFVEGRSPRLVGWAIGLSVVLFAMAVVARYQRVPRPWQRPFLSATLAAVPAVAFVVELVRLTR
ncbi:MAG TPA: hypothetical protein VJ717_05475 [Gemmatimonadaceae bacterium]|nr:hypothetical protein [Gemmatimonadaceae bacterium]